MPDLNVGAVEGDSKTAGDDLDDDGNGRGVFSEFLIYIEGKPNNANLVVFVEDTRQCSTVRYVKLRSEIGEYGAG